MTNPAFDPTQSASVLILGGQTVSADVSGAISDATIDLSITAASTLTLTIQDPHRVLVASPLFSQALSCSVVSGAASQAFTLVSVAKQSDVLTVTFEDALVHQLRLAQATGAGYVTSSGSMSRADFAKQVYLKATGTAITESFVTPPDGQYAQPVTEAGGMSWGTTANPTEDAWTCLVRLANEAQWRCFSTGSALYFGPDAWLLSFPVVATFQEWVGGVDNIDYTWDTGQAQATATVTLPTDLLTFTAGNPVALAGVGVANGDWLVSDMSRSLFLPDATITLAQPVPALSEAAIAASSSGANTSGAPSPTAAGTASSTAQSSQAAQAVKYAQAQVGKPYVWGGTGPAGYDCSGLVEQAWLSAGVTIPRTSEQQYSGLPHVDLSALEPGDLVFYNPGEDGQPGLPGHVVMYIGNGQMVEAPHTGVNIRQAALYPGAMGAARPAT